MAPAPSHSSGDVFFVKKGRLSRAWRRKMAGSNRVSPPGSGTESDDSEIQEERDHKEGLIRLTIANRSFDTLLQPIMDLKSGRAVGAEALSRFRDLPVRPPDVWFAEARSVGLGVELEIAALRLALEQLRRLPPRLYLSINASAETIMAADFRGALADVPAERVVLELTEHTKVMDYRRFGYALQDLRSMGVRLAVDDAGAGYASFRHVLNLRPDVIKLDIALTRGIDKDPARRALSSALLTFGLNAYNASMVAEGIETVGEFDTLRSLGCPFGQGFYLGRPGKLVVPQPNTATSGSLWKPQPSENAPVGPTHHDSPAHAQPVPTEKYREDYAEFLALATELKNLLTKPEEGGRSVDEVLEQLRS